VKIFFGAKSKHLYIFMLLQGKKLISSQQVAGYAILTIALIIVFCHSGAEPLLG
jgi:hypothetical protein